ncbi:hypothetical protein PG990_013547 [Apiospora arundinis]
MDQETHRALLEDLRKGRTPLPPIRTTRLELAPAFYRNSISTNTPSIETVYTESFQRSDEASEEVNAPHEDTANGWSESLNQMPERGMKSRRLLKESLFSDYTPEDVQHEVSARPQEPHTSGSSQTTPLHATLGEPEVSKGNCCILVFGLPNTVTVPEFIHEIRVRKLGKIAVIHLFPRLSFGPPRSIIKGTMWTRAGAERTMQAIRSHNFGFEGHRLQAGWHQKVVLPQRYLTASRVILVVGHPSMVSLNVLVPQFEEHFHFVIEKVVVKLFTTKVIIVDYRFGSYLNQAATAFHILRTSFPMTEVASVYIRDPCEPVEDDQLPYRQFPEHRQTLNPILDEAVQNKDSSASPTRVTSFHLEDVFTLRH